MPKPAEILRRVRRSSEGRTWSQRQVGELLDLSERQVQNYQTAGKLRPAPSVGGRTVYANDEVLRFLLEDYHLTRKERAVQS